MKVKFDGGFGIVYTVIEAAPVLMYSEVLGECTPHIKIEMLGYVPKRLLVFEICLN